MLLVEVTINAVVKYVSIDGHALTNNWRPRVLSFDAPQISIPSNHGGFAKMTFGSISFSQELFSGDWPPPMSCPIAIYYTDTTETARELVFEGTANLTSFNYEAINYDLMGPDYDETLIIRGVGPLVIGKLYEITEYVAGDDFVNVGGANVTGTIFTATGTTPTTWTNWSKLALSYNDTLNDVITEILMTIPEITSVNTSAARASSPNVTWTLTSDRIAINVASDIAEFYSHLIYVVGATAYLVDMKLNNGTWTLTEFDFFASPEYTYNTPIAVVKCGAVKRFSSHPYGTELSIDPYHITEANIITACDDILAIENSPRVAFDVPMIAGNFPALGEKIIIPDTAHILALSSWIRVRKLTYDFANDSISVEGEGAVAAA
jgi:hypothetical protein